MCLAAVAFLGSSVQVQDDLVNALPSFSLPADAPKDVQVRAEPARLIQEGKPVKLLCEVGKANPAVRSYMWYKDGSLQPEATVSTLIITHVAVAHSGSYSCAASNSVSTTRSLAVKLDVHCK